MTDHKIGHVKNGSPHVSSSSSAKRSTPGSATSASTQGEESDDHADRAPAPAGVFDRGHCRNCAQQADLLDQYHRVQREKDRLRATQQSARLAQRNATWGHRPEGYCGHPKAGK